MRVVLQRVTNASVEVNKELVSSIGKGFLLFVGITHEDTMEVIQKTAAKIAKLRIFEDEAGKMNKGLDEFDELAGEILCVSQFTLYADVKKGRRPSFDQAAKPEQAKLLYERFLTELSLLGCTVKSGIFQADMKVTLTNDGPVTIIVDSRDL